MKQFFVDRIEDGIAFCEDENENEVKLNIVDIKGKVKEGDVISVDVENNMYVDYEATARRRNEILELRKYIYKTKSKKTI